MKCTFVGPHVETLHKSAERSRNEIFCASDAIKLINKL